MSVVRAVGSRWVFAIAAIAMVHVALAQTAAHTGLIVAPDHRCLDAGAVVVGPTPQPVALAACDGRPSQRWVVSVGDYNYTRTLSGGCLSLRPGALSNAIELTIATCPQTPSSGSVTLSGTRLTAPGGCVTQRTTPTGVVLKVEPCAGIPEQRWSGR